jgi:DNA-binding LytR/AlgR family response regulator
MLKILLVDDEYLALNLLEQYAQQLPELEIVGKIKSPIQALDVLNREAIDVLFLDIQMPVLSGTNLLKTLQRPPKATVFTTAYSDYAVEAFNLNVVDYLLKPFAFERFLQAVNKAKEHILPQNLTQSPPSVPQPILTEMESFLTFKVDGKFEKIYPSDILYIEGLREYIRIVTTSRHYVTYESMKRMEEMLGTVQFMRVHKSFIVAKKQVTTLDGNQLEIGKVKIPISREKKDEVLAEIFSIKN